MDELHWDIFGDENDARDDALLSQARQLIRQCSCRRFPDSTSRCVLCKLLLAVFAHRLELEDDLPSERKSRLEIASSRASARPDHASVGPAPSTELGGEVLTNRPDVDTGDSTYEREWKDELNQLRRRNDAKQDEDLDWFRQRDATQREELDWLRWQDYQTKTTDPGDMDDELLHTIRSPNFSSPATLLVWRRFMSEHHQQVLRRRGITDLRRAGQITFGPSYGRGTARAMGLWANCRDMGIWFKFGCWIRRWRVILFGLFLSRFMSATWDLD